MPSARSDTVAASAATPATISGVTPPSCANRRPNVSRPASDSSSARAYASYSSAAVCARASSEARARADSTRPSTRPPERRTSSSTARPSSRSASAR
ncbi:hypothetical protein ACIGCZ_08075 [Streptomyces nigra]|uniref:hypothetical protein n=1 Tax=Streptomyces nigra TaxID=1827580 RepID=UPI0037D57939